MYILNYVYIKKERDMKKKIFLEPYEQEIEDSYGERNVIGNMKEEIDLLTRVAKAHKKRKKSITLRVHETDIEAMKIKASKMGIPYQTYINILIHRDATQQLDHAL